MVLWLTGLSGAGKTTIAQAIWARIKPIMPGLILLDGDVIRELFGAKLGFHEEARYQQIRRIQGLTAMLAKQNVPVIVAALYAHPDLMRWNCENLPAYFEVLVDAPLKLVRERDVKGLYAMAADGKMPHVVGLDIAWHRPLYPNLILDCEAGQTPEEMADIVIRKVPWLAATLGGAEKP